MRRIPDFDAIGDSLATFIRHDLAGQPNVVLVSHSQGGLVVQRYLARTLRAARGPELARIRRVVMFSCPNTGAEIMLLLRRSLWRHPQEADLRPINKAITEAQHVVLHRVIGASGATDTQWPIPIAAYAGDQDNVVTPTSARFVFPETGVLPGDHFSIIQPDSRRHRSYIVLKANLLAAIADASRPDVAASPTAAAVTTAEQAEIRSLAIRPAAQPIQPVGELVDALLAIPGLTDPAFRRRVYAGVPPPVVHLLERDSRARIELVSLVGAFEHYQRLHPWPAIIHRLTELLPDDPAVIRLIALVKRLGLLE